jgi:integrase
MTEGLTDHNPVVGTRRREEASRSRVLSAEELRAVWRALANDEFSAIVRLLCLTGCRREEVGGLRWAEISDDKITLPAQRTKNKREHVIPLSTAAQAIIDAQPRRVGREYVFGRGTGGFSGWSRCKARLDARLTEMTGKPLPGWTLHDIRRSCVTHMAELGVQPHIIEAVINHISGHKGGVAGVYNKASYEREKTAALATWADHLRTIVEGGERRIIPLRAPEASTDVRRPR